MTDQEIKERVINIDGINKGFSGNDNHTKFSEVEKLMLSFIEDTQISKSSLDSENTFSDKIGLTFDRLDRIRNNPENSDEQKDKIESFINIMFSIEFMYGAFSKVKEAKEDIAKQQAEINREKQVLKKQKAKRKREDRIEKRQKDKNTKVNIHTVNQMFSDNKQLSVFSEDKVDEFANNTGLNLTNKPTEYGVVLNHTQNRVFEGILKAFTKTDYKGDKKKDKPTALNEVYSNTPISAKTLVKADNAPYKNIDIIPSVKLSQADIIDLAGYDVERRRQSDKQHVSNAISFLSTKQFCFYWIRLKTKDGKPVKDKRGDYIKEEVMEIGTLFRIKTIKDQRGLLKYYEIEPSAPMLDQLNNYFLLLPINWRNEVKQLTGKTGSSYTYNFLLWLRLQYEQIRRYNKGGGKNRKARPFKITKSWYEIAIALKMPESMYKKNKPRSRKIIQEAYNIAIDLGYLIKIEDNGDTDVLYLNDNYYPKPGELK